MFDEVALRKTIQDYCDAREEAIAQFVSVWESINRVEESLSAIGNSLFPWEMRPRLSVEEFTRDLDNRLWRHSFSQIGLFQYMDKQARQEFETSLSGSAPPYTFENIRSTVVTAASQADMMFSRGLVNVFLGLSSTHKSNTNEPFKVNETAIIYGMIRPRWSGGLEVTYHSYGTDTLNDIDRVIKTLAGEKHSPRALETALNGALAHGCLYEDEYYKIRGYKNSNMHITFKRKDLLEKANRIIGEYYHGQALAGKH